MKLDAFQRKVEMTVAVCNAELLDRIGEEGRRNFSVYVAETILGLRHAPAQSHLYN